MALNVTLADDDMRVKFPAFGIDLKMTIPVHRLTETTLYSDVITDRYFINGEWVDKGRVLFYNKFDGYGIVLDIWQT